MNIPTFALRRGALLALSLTLVAALAACSGGDSTDPGTAATDEGGTGGTVVVTDGAAAISAADLAFDAIAIEASAGEAFTVTFTNNDGDPHNFSVYVEDGGEAIVTGNIINEGETDAVEVSALEPGEYFFVCDLHPDDMSGTIVVEG